MYRKDIATSYDIGQGSHAAQSGTYGTGRSASFLSTSAIRAFSMLDESFISRISRVPSYFCSTCGFATRSTARRALLKAWVLKSCVWRLNFIALDSTRFNSRDSPPSLCIGELPGGFIRGKVVNVTCITGGWLVAMSHLNCRPLLGSPPRFQYE